MESNNPNNMSLLRSIPDWTITNSFRAAYLTWDRSQNLATSRPYGTRLALEWGYSLRRADSQQEAKREFDYGEFPLEQFYNLILETNLEFSTGTIKQASIIGIEVNKNPFIISGGQIESFTSTSPTFTTFILPSPYVASDFISKKNYLGLFIAHEMNLSDRLLLYFEGTFEPVISDTTDLPELPSVEPIENNNFYPELSLSYELSNNIFLFTTVSYAAEPIEGTDLNDKPFDSEIYQGLELGIETELSDSWLAMLSFYHETQNNITTVDPNEPDFDLQINQQSSNSWTGKIQSEIIPGWWLYGFYTYTDATVTEDEVITVGSSVADVARHSGGLWNSYEIAQGVWQGLGFGGGFSVNGDRPGDTENSFALSSYFQTDAVVFYSQDNFRAAISVQNLFNAGIEDEQVTERSLFSTVWFQF